MNEFKKLREQSGMNMKRFAEYFGIPYRTVQNWEAGVNKCPDYLLNLMKFRLDHKEKHGHWKYGTRAAVCSECGFERNLDDNFGAAIACPNCGTDMERGGEK